MPDASAATDQIVGGAMAPSSTLYRRYRPAQFAEIRGQDHVTTALRNAVRENRVGHAYLFSGPRGTGKTTTARLLARTLNCLDLGADGEPCGTCANCLAIAAGEFADLFELDAASNRGVDAIRDVIQSVGLGLSVSSQRKVYVIDEVHMLTDAASNTLLKTLEEPPRHVVFVLATTEPGKVLPTIRSRTQHFEFALFENETLKGLVESVLEREEVAPDDEAVDLVVRRAAGSARDALSFLDQALALGGGSLDVEAVRQAFGETDVATCLTVLEAVAASDPPAALSAVATTLASGSDPRRFVEDLLRAARDAFVLATSHGLVRANDNTAEQAGRLQALGERLDISGSTRVIDALGQAVVDIRSPATPDPRLVLEVCVVRLARPTLSDDANGLSHRVAHLEREVAALRAAPPASGTSSARAVAESVAKPALGGVLRSQPQPRSDQPPVSGPPAEPAGDPPAPAPEQLAGTVDVSIEAVVKAWPAVLSALSAPVRSQVDHAFPLSVADGVITFGAPSVHVRRINQKFRENAAAIKAALQAQLGALPKLKVVGDERFETGLAKSGDEASPAPADTDDGPPDEVDISDIVDSPGADAPLDSTSRLVEAFDATVVDEQPR